MHTPVCCLTCLRWPGSSGGPTSWLAVENSWFLENATLLSEGGHVTVLELLLQFLGVGMGFPTAQKVGVQLPPLDS